MAKNQYTNSAQLYDEIYPIGKFHDDVDFFASFLDKTSLVLDLGCGTGRVAIELAKICSEVHAVDLSIEMLNVFTQKISEKKLLNIHVYNHDMSSFFIDTTFSLIVFPFNSFQSLTLYKEQLFCLQHCKTMLSANGLIVLNIFNPDINFLGGFDTYRCVDFESTVAESHITRESFGLEHCASRQLIKGKYSFTISNGSHRHVFTDDYELGYLFPAQLFNIVREVGLDIKFQYEGWNRSPFKKESGQLILGLGL